MNTRQEALLKAIISCYLKQACPVGSKHLEQKGFLNVSAATIRNEMAELEKNGYIAQPHTSAGRVPTDKGYRYFLEKYLAAKINSKDERDLAAFLNSLKRSAPEELIKLLCRKLALLSDGAVVASFSDNNYYYTGLANLFSHPEILHPEIISELGEVIDHLDKYMNDLFNVVTVTAIYIGSENPFGSDLSAIVTKWQLKGSGGMLGIIGPLRMDYERNVALINYINAYLA